MDTHDYSKVPGGSEAYNFAPPNSTTSRYSAATQKPIITVIEQQWSK